MRPTLRQLAAQLPAPLRLALALVGYLVLLAACAGLVMLVLVGLARLLLALGLPLDVTGAILGLVLLAWVGLAATHRR